MPPPTNGASDGLAQYTAQSDLEWNLSRLIHLYRRTTLGAYY